MDLILHRGACFSKVHAVAAKGKANKLLTGQMQGGKKAFMKHEPLFTAVLILP